MNGCMSQWLNQEALHLELLDIRKVKSGYVWMESKNIASEHIRLSAGHIVDL